MNSGRSPAPLIPLFTHTTQLTGTGIRQHGSWWVKNSAYSLTIAVTPFFLVFPCRNCAPSEFATWAKLTEVYISLGMYESVRQFDFVFDAFV